MAEIPLTAIPLRIAMTSYYMPSDSKIGVGYQVHALANAMVGRGHEVTVFTVCPPSDGARYRTVQLASPRSMRTFAFAFSLREVDFKGFDVLHAHGDDYWLWRRRVPAHVRTMHGSCFAEAVRIPGLKEKTRMVALGLGEVLASLVADRTVVVSPDTRRYMPWVRRVVPNGVSSNLFHPDLKDRDVVPTVLFVGTYHNRKRGRLLAELFSKQIRPAVPEARLVMVCSDAPALDGVLVTGRIDDQELASWYRRAWVFCLPSTYEGFGIPYAEALMSGTPVVASPNPGARFVLDDGRFGQLVPDHEIAPAVIRLLADAAANREATGRAVSGAASFDMDRVVTSYEAIYASIMNPARPGGRQQ